MAWLEQVMGGNLQRGTTVVLNWYAAWGRYKLIEVNVSYLQFAEFNQSTEYMRYVVHRMNRKRNIAHSVFRLKLLFDAKP